MKLSELEFYVPNEEVKQIIIDSKATEVRLLNKTWKQFVAELIKENVFNLLRR